MIPTDVSQHLAAIERVVEGSTPDEASAIIGELERVKALLWARLMTPPVHNAHQDSSSNGDELLTAEEAARLLGVPLKWIRNNAKKLPFIRKLGPRTNRYSKAGLERWVAARRI